MHYGALLCFFEKFTMRLGKFGWRDSLDKQACGAGGESCAFCGLGVRGRWWQQALVALGRAS